MNNKLTIPMLILTGSILAGCSSEPTATSPSAQTATTSWSDNPSDMNSITSAETASPASRSIASEGMDGEVMAYLMALDNQEIMAASQALSKNVSEPITTYAQMLQTDHRANMQKTQSAAESINLTAMDTPAVDDFKTKGSSDIAKLDPLSGPEYEKAFMDMMVKGHREALTMIDNQLMSQAQSEPMKAQLQESRKHIAAHLEVAEKIQSEIQK